MSQRNWRRPLRRPSNAVPSRPSPRSRTRTDQFLNEVRRFEMANGPKGYVILTEAIKDPEGMKAYARAAGAAMSGATILAVDAAPKVIEGSWHGDQTVVLEFESVDAARAWYES